MTAKAPLVMHVIYALGTGGLENGLVNIINRSPPRRYRHVIVCLTTAHAFADRLTRDDVSVIELNKQAGHDPAVYKRLIAVVRDLKPDIIHTRNLAALETHVIGLLFPRIRRVHGEHGRDVNDLDGSNWRYRMLRKTLRPLVHRYIAVSRDLASWLGESIRVAPERISQIYNGVDSSQFFPAAEWSSALFPEGFLPDGDVIVLGTIGRLAEVKDQARVLKMLAVLCADKPALRERLRLVVVGDGPLKDRLREQAVALGIHDLVWMPGDRSDIPALLRAMHIFLLPSLAEGISNTVLEAMATGLPVVATDVGGNPELVRHGVSGYLVPLQDEVRLAQAVSELVDNPQLRQAMGRSALERINTEFDWGKTVNNYLAVYDDLLNNSRSDKRQGNGMVTEG